MDQGNKKHRSEALIYDEQGSKQANFFLGSVHTRVQHRGQLFDGQGVGQSFQGKLSILEVFPPTEKEKVGEESAGTEVKNWELQIRCASG